MWNLVLVSVIFLMQYIIYHPIVKKRIKKDLEQMERPLDANKLRKHINSKYGRELTLLSIMLSCATLCLLVAAALWLKGNR